MKCFGNSWCEGLYVTNFVMLVPLAHLQVDSPPSALEIRQQRLDHPSQTCSQQSSVTQLLCNTNITWHKWIPHAMKKKKEFSMLYMILVL